MKRPRTEEEDNLIAAIKTLQSLGLEPPEPIMTRLFSLLHADNRDTILAAIDPNALGLLPQAVETNRIELVQHLLSWPNIDVNRENSDGDTALGVAMVASGPSSVEMVQLLLAHPNIDVNVLDPEGWPVLTAAAHDGMTQVVQMLLCAPNVDVNIQFTGLSNALKIAVEKCGTLSSIQVVTMLLEHPSIDVNLPNMSNGVTALMAAVRVCNTTSSNEAVRLLLARPDINVNSVANDGWTALLMAARYSATDSSMDALCMLLAHPDINVNVQLPSGKTALMMAATRIENGSSEETIFALVKHRDTDFFIQDNSGKIAFERCKSRKGKFIIFRGILTSRYQPFPVDVSKMLALRRLYNHLLDRGNLPDLRVLASFLRFPGQVNAMTLQGVCNVICDILATGHCFDAAQYATQQAHRHALLTRINYNFSSALASFKRGIQEVAGIDPEGVTVDQLMIEFNKHLAP
jgi:ankyrin repeat protein